jgi:hypothetical protein
MRKLLSSALGLCVLAVAATGATMAVAQPPDHALNATTDSGNGCLVRDADGVYWSDPGCSWHTVTRTDRDGNRVIFSYHDHGQLPPGAAVPSRASRNSGTIGIGMGQTCDYTEVTSPSGQYRSDCRVNR